jgi:hypothetical protein
MDRGPPFTRRPSNLRSESFGRPNDRGTTKNFYILSAPRSSPQAARPKTARWSPDVNPKALAGNEADDLDASNHS